MAQLNHTIVACEDPQSSATYLAELLGLEDPVRFGPFQVVELSNGVSLDYMRVSGDVPSQHYAFLVTEDEFEDVFARIKDREIAYWADPGRQQPEQINHRDGGRGVYFAEPNGHSLEIITRPYGG